MGEIKVCRAEIGDAEQLSYVGATTFSDKFAHLYDPRDLQAFLDESHCVSAYNTQLRDPEVGIWKAMDEDERIVGYAVAAPCHLPVDDMPKGAMEISRLYVMDGYQSLGLGRQLMDAMLGWIDRDGTAPLYLSVYKYNDGAQRFYQRYGFGLLKEYRYKVGNHYDPEYLYVRNV